MANFALIGAAGYIAPRHMKAIKETGNQLVAALDPHDSVGILDSYFPECSFFTEFERFDRHLEKLRRNDDSGAVEYVSICSPNYLHDAHVRAALRVKADAICEKPLVLNPWNVVALQELEQEFGQRVWTVLQLRAHPAVLALKAQVEAARRRGRHQVELTYITSRGEWYLRSWKGLLERSGGLATNIGVHFFDMLIWVFGDIRESEVHLATPTTVAGYLELERASVPWLLSIEAERVPETARAAGQRTYRSVQVDGTEVEFSRGFADLHTRIYEKTLVGEGFGTGDARAAIEAVYAIRQAEPTGRSSRSHPML